MALPYERIFEDRPQTPIYEFVHPDNESTISLVGMVHMAIPNFYRNVNRYTEVRENQGSLVHSERSTLPDEATLSSYPTWVRDTAQQLHDIRTRLFTPQAGSNRVAQSNPLYFQYKDSWKYHDIHLAEITSSLGRFRAEYLINTLAGISQRGRIINYLRVLSLPMLTDGVLVKQRNDVALQAVKEATTYNPDQSLTLLWGAAHLPGIAKGIMARRYMHTNTIWHCDG